MASGKSTQTTGVTTGVLSSEEGYTLVRAWEESKYEEMMHREGKLLRVESYQVSDSPRAWNVQIVVYAQGYEDQRKAEWAVYMLVKNLHPSVYKENKISFIHEGGFRVVVAWALWKPRSLFPVDASGGQ
jgi:hypothetical protein